MKRNHQKTELRLLILLLLVLPIMGCGGGSKGSSADVTSGAYIIDLGSEPTPLNDADAYKNFYGISWKGKAADNLRYANNMSYKYVFYQEGAGELEVAKNFQFFFDGPLATAMVEMSGMKTWGLYCSQWGSYSETTREFIRKNAVYKSNSSGEPDNFASGCMFDADHYMLNFDLQNTAVRSDVVTYCIKRVNDIKAKYPNIRFGGFAFDAPELTGEFHMIVDGKIKGVTLSDLRGDKNGKTDTCACGKEHQLSTYTEAMTQFFLDLKSVAATELNSNAKTIVEPYWIYENWVGQIQKYAGETKGNQLTAKTFASQEGGLELPGAAFYNDQNILQFGITKDNIGCSTPDVHDEPGNRLIAAKAAVQGSWFNWFGRFGGTGDYVDYDSIAEVPAWLKLIRMVANWDNLSNATGRDWDGTVYRSSNSYMDGNVIATRNPYTGKLFVVFLNKNGKVTLNSNEKIKSVKRIDAYFGEAEDGSGDLATETGADGQTILRWK